MDTTALAQAIARQEGYGIPGSVATRLNNPGNLVYVGQSGATPVRVTGADGKVRTFASWPTPDEGWAGLVRDLELKASRGMDLQAIINAWAPASDGNNTTKYYLNVARFLGIDTDTNPAAGSPSPAPSSTVPGPVYPQSTLPDFTAPSLADAFDITSVIPGSESGPSMSTILTAGLVAGVFGVLLLD